jgi:hypothetical protein
MLVLRLPQRLRTLFVAVFTAAAVCTLATSAFAQDNHPAAAKRGTTSLVNSQPSNVVGAPQAHTGIPTGFLYFPGAQPGMNIGGRLNVSKHVYVPYYGNVSNDPAHPGVQGTAGIAYGFRTWDISVLNGGFGTVQPALPGSTNDAPKVSPALTFSIRF